MKKFIDVLIFIKLREFFICIGMFLIYILAYFYYYTNHIIIWFLSMVTYYGSGGVVLFAKYANDEDFNWQYFILWVVYCVIVLFVSLFFVVRGGRVLKYGALLLTFAPFLSVIVVFYFLLV